MLGVNTAILAKPDVGSHDTIDYDSLRTLKRSDIVLVRHHKTRHFTIILVRHVRIDESAKTVQVYGCNLGELVNLKSPASESSAFLESFRKAADVEVAVARLKSAITEPILEGFDEALRAFEKGSPSRLGVLMPAKAAQQLLAITFDERDTIWLHPFAGAIRKHLLGSCPFDCDGDRGWTTEELQEAYRSKWFEFMSTQGIEETWQSCWDLPCPGCMGIDFYRDQVKRQVRTYEFSQAEPVHAILLDEQGTRLNARNVQLGYGQGVHISALGMCGLAEPYPEGHLYLVETIEKESARLTSIETLPKAKYVEWKEVIGEDNCGVCKQLPYEDEDIVSRLSCGHIAHKACLALWLQTHGDCPVCHFMVEGHAKGKGEREVKIAGVV